MGFFKNLRKAVRRQKAPVMPRRGGFLGGMPQTKPAITDMRFRGRMPQKLSGLSGLFRRLQEQIRNQQMPQPIPERMPVNNLPSFNPTIFGQPIGNMDFSQMPQISPEERMAPPVMNQMQGQPRMMMSRGRDANMVDFLNSDPQQQIFGIETKIGILENQLEEAKANNDRQAYDMIVDQINDADAQIIDIKNSINPLRTSGRPEMVGPKFDGFEEFITSIGPQNYGDYVGEPTLDDILSETIPAPISYREILGESGRTLSNRDLERLKPRDIRAMLGESGRTISNMDRDYLDDILSDLEKKN